MSLPNDRTAQGVSRRSFLAASGAVAAASVAASSVSVAAADEAAAAPAAPAVPNYKVFETDILVIGAGMAAMAAVDEAIRQGKSVMVLDKAPFGFGGGSGMNWDVCYTWNPSGSAISAQTNNLNATMTAHETDRFQPNDYMPILNWGEVLTNREDDGNLHFKMDLPNIKMVEWGFPRHWMDQLSQAGTVTVHDYTMVTDIFVNDGKCLGAVALYLPTGEYRVYRAKSTVLATGGCSTMYGWVTVSPITNQSLDNTADVDMAIFRHGGRIGDAEHAAYDMMGIVPTAWACSIGTMFGGDSMDINFFLNSDGELFCLREEYDQQRMLYDRPYFNQIVAREMMAGKGGPNGGILLPAGDEVRDIMRYMYLRCVNRIEGDLGIDLREQPMECMLEMYEHGGTPVIDDKLMSTEFDGLFCIRGAGTCGETGGTTNTRERQLGQYAMKNAIAYMDAAEPLAAIDWSDAEREFARLEELRTREVADPIRPVTIQRKIQEIGYQNLNIIRTAENLEAARAELKRIMDEDIPRMALSDHSSAYNRDWKDAIETINLLDICRLGIEGTYVRPESRGNFYRPEFPEQNDAEWGCTLAFYQGEDGELAYDKIFWPALEA